MILNNDIVVNTQFKEKEIISIESGSVKLSDFVLMDNSNYINRIYFTGNLNIPNNVKRVKCDCYIKLSGLTGDHSVTYSTKTIQEISAGDYILEEPAISDFNTSDISLFLPDFATFLVILKINGKIFNLLNYDQIDFLIESLYVNISWSNEINALDKDKLVIVRESGLSGPTASVDVYDYTEDPELTTPILSSGNQNTPLIVSVPKIDGHTYAIKTPSGRSGAGIPNGYGCSEYFGISEEISLTQYLPDITYLTPITNEYSLFRYFWQYGVM